MNLLLCTYRLINDVNEYIVISKDKVRLTGVGCYISHVCVSISLYADDILLIAPSVSALQILLGVCEDELRMLDMQLNTKKSICIRFGERHKVLCAGLASSSGGVIDWKNGDI